jgi:hypothetical protein
MVGILRGGFATSREPSDLVEVQGRYGSVIQRFEVEERSESLIRVTKTFSLLMNSHIGVLCVETP